MLVTPAVPARRRIADHRVCRDACARQLVQSHGLGDVRFEVQGPLLGGVCREHPITGPLTDRSSLGVGEVEVLLHVGRARGRQDFDVRLEEVLESIPCIADDCCAARRGFEEADARRMAETPCFGAREIQGESLSAIEGRVRERRQVLHAVDVRRPGDGDGIQRAGHREVPRRLVDAPHRAGVARVLAVDRRHTSRGSRGPNAPAR